MTVPNSSVVIVKPDAFRRNVVGLLIQKFESLGYVINTARFFGGKDGFPVMGADSLRQRLEEHYCQHKGKEFYPGLINFMVGGPLLVLNLVDIAPSGEPSANSVVATVREIALGLRRGMGTGAGPENLIHASDSAEEAAREFAVWFGNVYPPAPAAVQKFPSIGVLPEEAQRHVVGHLATKVIGSLKDMFETPPLFAFMLFDGSPETRYASNVDRGDMVKALRELAARLESGS